MYEYVHVVDRVMFLGSSNDPSCVEGTRTIYMFGLVHGCEACGLHAIGALGCVVYVCVYGCVCMFNLFECC